jgi:AhpC/TSA family
MIACRVQRWNAPPYAAATFPVGIAHSNRERLGVGAYAVARGAAGGVGGDRDVGVGCCAVQRSGPQSLVMTASPRSRVVCALLAAVVLVLSMSAADRAGAVESGQPAPEFKLPSTLGNDIALSDFRGKKWVLLEFYSADFAAT